jgi:pseudouridine-5'-phosphate glycosidase/pseudouridine kinase
LIVVGSSAVDITAQAEVTTNDALAAHSTAPGSISVSLGGVARNIAEASHRVLTAQSSDLSSLLVSPIGEDLFGTLMIEDTKKIGMRFDGFILSNKRTAICNMILESNGNLVSGVADMGITASLDGDLVRSCTLARADDTHVDAAQILPLMQKHKPSIVALDGNLSVNTIKSLVSHCIKNGVPG